MTTAITADLVDCARIAASRVYKSYRHFISRDDLDSAALMWLHQHPVKVAGMFSGTDDQRELAKEYRRLTNAIARYLSGVARAEKAAATGYSVDDEYFYGLSLIREVLPAVWNEEDAAFPPQTQEPGMPRSNQDPAESGSWFAMVADVKRAVRSAGLETHQLTALSLRYGTGLTLEQVGKAMSISRTTAAEWIEKAERSVAYALNGIRPDYCNADCEHDG